MADQKISDFTSGTVDSTAQFDGLLTVGGLPVNRRFSIASLVSYILPSVSFPKVVGTPVNLTGQSASVASLATYTLTAADGTFEILSYLNVTAQASSKTVTISVAFVDVHGNPQSSSFMSASSVIYNGKERYFVRAQGGSTITVSANLSGAGTITYDAGVTIVQLNNS